MYSYVYFITDGHGHIKIGKADDVVSRLNELQTGNPFKLHTLLSIIVNSKREAFNLELSLHKKFKEYRLEGEWFEEKPVFEFIDKEYIEIDNFKFGGLKYGKEIKNDL